MDKTGAKLIFGEDVRKLQQNLKLAHAAGAAAALQDRVGDTSNLGDFSQFSKCDIHVLPPNSLQLAATTTYANGTWTINPVTDRWRYILGFGFELSNLNAAAGTRMGDGPLVQLRNLGVILFNLSTGKSTPEGYAGYDLGPIHAYPDGLTTGVYHADVQDQLRNRLLWGRSIEQAIARPIDVWVPSQGGSIDISGIGGVTVADSNSGVLSTLHVLVADFMK